MDEYPSRKWLLAHPRSSGAFSVLLLSIGFSLMFSACEPGEVRFKFDNRTESVLCYYPFPEEAATRDCSAAVSANDVTRWNPECAPQQEIAAILTVRETNEQIYSRTMTCRDWRTTNRIFVIE